MTETVTISGTAQEIIDYLRNRGAEGAAQYLLTAQPTDIAVPAPSLSSEEEDRILDELGGLARGRLDPSLRYDREDIYFDR